LSIYTDTGEPLELAALSSFGNRARFRK